MGLMNTPSIVKVLRYLKDVKTPVSPDDVITATGESQTLVLTALDKLTSEGIIDNKNNTFRYVSSIRADDLSEKLFQLYCAVTKEPEMELTLRGIICHLGSLRAYLRLKRIIEIMEKDGHSGNDVSYFLKKEENAGHIEKLWITFVPKETGTAVAFAYGEETGGKIRTTTIPKAPCPSPLTIPIYYMTWFFEVSAEELRRLKLTVLGESSDNPEEYITGNYPGDLAEVALKYLTTKKKAMAETLKEEARKEWDALRLY